MSSGKLSSKSKTLYYDSEGNAQTLLLSATIKPANATDQSIKWSSSNKKVATVDQSGLVTAVKKGSATITAKSSNGKKATCKVTVKKSKTPLETEKPAAGQYRALLIANGAYPDDDARTAPVKAAAGMQKALADSVYQGKRFSRVEVKKDLTNAGMRAALAGLSGWGVGENDVTLVYYAGHGALNAAAPAGNRSYLCGIDTQTYQQCVGVSELQKYLDALPGKVFVILDCCNSGGFISKDGGANDFSSDVIQAFAAAQAKDLRGSKYHVLTACAEKESTYSFGDAMIMTYSLVYGAGYNYMSQQANDLYADLNGDGKVTFGEAHKLTQELVNELIDYYNQSASEKISPVNVQAYPLNDATQLFGKSA